MYVVLLKSTSETTYLNNIQTSFLGNLTIFENYLKAENYLVYNKKSIFCTFALVFQKFLETIKYLIELK